jgi:hypothetical protein
MLDLTLGAGIFAGMASAVYANSGGTTNQANSANFISQVAALQKQMTMASPTGYSVGTYTAATLIANGIAPFGFQNGATALKHPWSTASDAITVAGVTASTNSQTYKYVPQTTCAQVMRSLTTTTGVIQVVVNGGTAITTLPADTTAITTNCTSSNANTIVITSG